MNYSVQVFSKGKIFLVHSVNLKKLKLDPNVKPY